MLRAHIHRLHLLIRNRMLKRILKRQSHFHHQYRHNQEHQYKINVKQEYMDLMISGKTSTETNSLSTSNVNIINSNNKVFLTLTQNKNFQMKNLHIHSHHYQQIILARDVVYVSSHTLSLKPSHSYSGWL